MCIIAVKKAGVAFPSDETIKTMFQNNRDGAGFMYVRNGRVIIHKGLMKIEHLLNALHGVCADVDPVTTPFVIHCRITTHGGTCPECTHPFPISDNMALLRKSYMETDVGVAHNGIIRSVTPRDKHTSDTQEFIAQVLSPLKRGNKYFYHSVALMELVSNLAGSKLAFLTDNGRVYTIGEFITEADGMMYSNGSYKPAMPFIKPLTLGSYGAQGYTTYTRDRTDTRYKGTAVRYLMTLADAPSYRSSMTFHTDDGHTINAFAHAIDNSGRLYKYDADTDTYYGVSYKPVEKLPAWNLHFADRFECFANAGDLLARIAYDRTAWDE